jgi:hypothetical protein
MNSTKKLPERRSHHASFIFNHNLYIYGGHDIKDGSNTSLWSLNLSNLHKASDSDSMQEIINNLAWIEIPTKGQKPRKFYPFILFFLA